MILATSLLLQVKEADEGVETVPASDTVGQIDYTELLQQQNEHLESLVMETRKMNYKLDDLSHAMPIMACMLGFVWLVSCSCRSLVLIFVCRWSI